MNDKNNIMRTGILDSRFPSARGLTLVELMVASAIIAMMILWVGGVLSGLGKLVSGSQATIRANETASAIGYVAASDTRRVGQNGFLCITQAADGTPQLFVFSFGPTPSATGLTPNAVALLGTATQTPPASPGNAALSCMGECDNTGMGSGSSDTSGHGSIVWHATWIPNPAAGQSDANANLYDSSTPTIGTLTNGFAGGFLTDPAQYQSMCRWDCNTLINAYQSAPNTLPVTIYPLTALPSAPINLPPSTLSDLNNMWKILSIYASSMGITWTDGTIVANPNDNNNVELRWYGVDPNSVGGPVFTKAGSLSEYSTYNSSNLPTEFNVNGKYRALFCHDDGAGVWPTAIKIRFKLTDPSAPKEFDLGGVNGVWYEIICPISQ